MLHALAIGFIPAGSPQAKGRIERLWQTLQDRLVSELRLHGIATPEAANAFLPAFRADHNRRFARPPARPRPAWRPPPRELPLLLGCRYARRVAADNTVRLGLRGLQLPPGPRRRSWAGLGGDTVRRPIGRYCTLGDKFSRRSTPLYTSGRIIWVLRVGQVTSTLWHCPCSPKVTGSWPSSTRPTVGLRRDANGHILASAAR